VEFLDTLAKWIEFIWPFKIIHQWETGGLYVFGRFQKTLPPGCYFIVPFFMWIAEISTVPYMVVTPRMDLTLLDGSNLTLWATAWGQVTDYNLAHNSVEDYQHTTTELLQAVIADKIAQVDASRLAPEKRSRLLSDLTRWCNEETKEYGLEISHVRFTTFVLNARTYRLIQ